MAEPDKYRMMIELDRKTEAIQTEIKWTFESPHEGGHAIGNLVRTLTRAFEKQNPGKSREEIAQAICDGIACMIPDEFLDGDDSDMLTEH